MEKFIRPWNSRGKPDLTQLPVLVSAWDRSHFLFRNEVTGYLRKMWLDAIQADLAEQVINGTISGDRDQPPKEKQFYFLKYVGNDEERRRVFMDDMRH